jgi:hypothetical protein
MVRDTLSQILFSLAFSWNYAPSMDVEFAFDWKIIVYPIFCRFLTMPKVYATILRCCHTAKQNLYNYAPYLSTLQYALRKNITSIYKVVKCYFFNDIQSIHLINLL